MDFADHDFEWIEHTLAKYSNEEGLASASELDGFLTAITIGPCREFDQEEVIWGGGTPKWSSQDEAIKFNECVKLMLEEIKEISENEEEFVPVMPLGEINGQEVLEVVEWSFGFARGLDFWEFDADSLPTEVDQAIMSLLIPNLSCDPSKYEEIFKDSLSDEEKENWMDYISLKLDGYEGKIIESLAIVNHYFE